MRTDRSTTETPWWAYVVKVAGNVPQEQIARRIDVATPTVSRWRGSTPKPESVAAFARAYGRPVMEAFIAAGFMTQEEAGQTPAAALDPRQLSDDELIAEVIRRIKLGGQGDDEQKMSGDADGSTGDPGPASLPPLRTGRTVGRGPRIARDPAESDQR